MAKNRIMQAKNAKVKKLDTAAKKERRYAVASAYRFVEFKNKAATEFFASVNSLQFKKMWWEV